MHICDAGVVSEGSVVYSGELTLRRASAVGDAQRGLFDISVMMVFGGWWYYRWAP